MGASDLLQEERWTAEPRRGHRGIKQRLVNTAFKESPKESKTNPAEIERPRKDQFSQWLSELMQYTTIIKKREWQLDPYITQIHNSLVATAFIDYGLGCQMNDSFWIFSIVSLGKIFFYQVSIQHQIQ